MNDQELIDECNLFKDWLRSGEVLFLERLQRDINNGKSLTQEEKNRVVEITTSCRKAWHKTV